MGIVGVRKGEEKADRVGRFLAGFVGVALDYGLLFFYFFLSPLPFLFGRH